MRLWPRKTPDPTPDLDAARRARKRTEHALEQSHDRWHDVRRIVAESRRIRQVSHRADDLRTIFGGD